MLFFLTSINSDTTYYLIHKSEFIVGRRDCDILIENDVSVSRKHAEIRIKETKRDEIVTLKDLGSKYKTLHNGKEITPQIEIQINCNDRIQFGGLSSIFILKQERIITTATKLSFTHKDALKKQLNLLKGQYVENWSSKCTHLTLEKIGLTVKVLHALLDNKQIVLPSYWSKYTANVKNNLPPPDIKDYSNPPVEEALLNKVEIRKDISRNDLFKNKTFIFLTEKEKQQVDELVTHAGGTCISWEKNPINLKHITQSKQQFLLIQTNQVTDDKAYDAISKHFSKQGMRSIPTQEIAMAIIHGSCLKDCNPLFDRTKEVFHAKDIEKTQNEPLVEKTQTQSNLPEKNKATVIDLTIPESETIEIPPIKKRKPENNSVQEKKPQSDNDNPFKRIKVRNTPEVKDNENMENQSSGKENYLKETNVIRDAREKSNDNSQTIYIQASTSKRNIETDDNEENPFKKMKLKTPGWSSRFPPQNNPSNESLKESNKNEQQSVSQSQKRNTEATKSNNPFIDIFKRKPEKTANEISGSTTTLRSDTTISSDNPFVVDIPANASNVFSSTKIGEKTVNEPLCYTKSTTSDLNGNWISKNSPVNVDEIIPDYYDDWDENRKRFIDLFKDKLIIEVQSQLPIISRRSSDEIDCAVSSGKNFKKFKKVKPLHPQTLIISRDSFVEHGPDDITGINDARRMLDDSDNENTPKKQKRKFRTFDI